MTATHVKKYGPSLAFSRGFASTLSTTLASSPRPEENVNTRPLTTPRSTRLGLQSSAMASTCSVASTTSPGIPSIFPKTFAEPPGSGQSGVDEPQQPVRGFVHRAVAAEGDDHVIALPGGRPAELDRVPRRLRVDRVNLEAALQRHHDEVAKPVGDRAGIRVDDQEHPAPCARGRQSERPHRPRTCPALADALQCSPPLATPGGPRRYQQPNQPRPLGLHMPSGGLLDSLAT